MAKLGNYYVKWTHKNNGLSLCTIKKDNEIISLGDTIKNPQDRPDRRIARRVSFERAMDNAEISIPKKERGLIWNDYLSKVRQPE